MTAEPAPVEDTASLRKARGAFFTPAALCDWVSTWAIRSPDDTVLEPSCGDAEFLLAAGTRLTQLGAPGSVLRGIELHSRSAQLATRRLERAGHQSAIAIGDFFDTTPTKDVTAVVGNPPYVRYQGHTASPGMGPGDGWAPIYFRYLAFIPEDKIWGGLPSGDIYRPFRMYNGNGRWYDPNGSSKYRFTSKVSFGASHNVEITKSMGTTIAYSCSTPWGTDCIQVGSATAPESQLSWINVNSGATTADFTLVAAAKHPLMSVAPPIDAGVGFHLRPGGTTVRGIHDRMPVHEIYFYVEGWGEWEPIYQSDSWNPFCLGRIRHCSWM